jgi:hypothetical protein
MNAEIFAEWLHRQGHRIYKTKSSFWYDPSPHVLQAFPYHWVINPDDEEIHDLMFKNRILALRYSVPFDHPKGKISYHIVLEKSYDLLLLNKKARNSVKRGMERFTVQEISFDRLATEGWVLQEDTLKRQNRLRSMSQKQWENLCHSANNLPGFQVFAAINGVELAAAVIVCRIDDVYTTPFAMSHCRFLQDHVNNALFFSISCDLLKRDNAKGLFFTVQSLDAPPNVDEFKLRMGFEPRKIRQNIVLHPYIKPLITPTFHMLNQKLLQHYPSNPFLAKTEGMIRFYLEGQRPASEQNLPECLREEL